MLKTNDEQELARRLAALEKAKPDGPYALRLLEKDPKEYQALKEVYEQAMADLRVAPTFQARIQLQANREGKKYHEYLMSTEWAEKRQACLEYYDHHCSLCYDNEQLQVHHRTYERVYHESPSDLIALCDNCHKKFHNIIADYFLFNSNIPY